MAGGVVPRLCGRSWLWHLGDHQAWAAAAPFILLWACRSCRSATGSACRRSLHEAKSVVAGRRASSPVDCPPDLALLRDVCFTQRTTRYLPTIFRKLPSLSSLTEPRLRISGCIFFPPSALATSDGWARWRRLSGWKPPSATMSQMELFRGHFYNWYDTRDLHPLEPRVRFLRGQRKSRRASAGSRQQLPGADGEIIPRSRTSLPELKMPASLLREALRANCGHAAHAYRHAEATQQCSRHDGGLARSVT